MSTIRRFCCNDLLRMNNLFIDSKNVETRFVSWYLSYIAVWPNYFNVAEAPGNRIMGYIISKVQGEETDKHGYITGVAVAKEYRKVFFVKNLVDRLEDIHEKIDNAYFMDVLVSAANTRTKGMYERLGFEFCKRVPDREKGDELLLRKELSGLKALKEFMATMQKAAAEQQAEAAKLEMPYEDSGSSWPSDDGETFYSDDDDRTSVPSQDVTTMPSACDPAIMPSQDVTSVLSEGSGVANVPAGDSAD